MATFNSGTRLAKTVRSLLRQSLHEDEYELVFVDDGSTDTTVAYCRSLAERHRNVQVHSIERSGWPGRPRNVGVNHARGEYVLFVDHDDYLFPEALERMYTYAKQNRSDVLLGKEVVKGGATAGWTTWKANQPVVEQPNQSLLQLLTPHKLYRRQFLLDHDVSFPEGRVRLEDYAFNAQVFARAARISVLADYPCYQWVIHPGNAHSQGLHKDAYWNSFRTSLQPALELPAGPARDQLLLRWYRGRVLRRVGTSFASASPRRRAALMSDLGGVLDLFPESLDAKLAAADRTRSALLRAGAQEALVTLAHLDRGMTLRLDDIRYRRGVRGLAVRAEATVCDAAGHPVPFESGPVGLRRSLPEDLNQHLVRHLDLSSELASSVVEVSVRGRRSGVEWAVPGHGRARFVPHGAQSHLVVSVAAVIQPSRVAFGQRLAPDTWRIWLRADLLGFQLRTRIRRPDRSKPATMLARGDFTVARPGRPGATILRATRRLARRLRHRGRT